MRFVVDYSVCKCRKPDSNIEDNNSKEKEMHPIEVNGDSKQESESERSQSEERIWLETYLPMIGGAIILLLIVLGVLVTRKKR